jgi:hypothetical protein
MTVTISAATITGITTDSGISATDFIANDQTLILSGAITGKSGFGSGTLGIWLSGGSFGTGNGGKGTLVGTFSVGTSTSGWSYDLTTSSVVAAKSLADGTYTIHIRNGSSRFASDLASHSLVEDHTSAAAPAGLDLVTADDSGASSTDNLTKQTAALTIRGSAETGATVTLFDDANNNSALDAGETLGTVTASAGAFSKDVVLGGDGVHHVRAFQTDAAGNVSAVSTTLDITLDTAAATPAGLELAAADDSGASSTDNLTKQTAALTITGSAETGATVTLFDDANNNSALDAGETLGTVTASAGAFSKDITLNGDGVHHVRAFQTDIAGNVSVVSTTLDITLDTAAATPAGLDLAAADDSGASSTDNLTSQASALTFTGSAETGATITLFDDANNNSILDAGETLGKVTASAGAFSKDIALNGDGVHRVRAFQTDTAGNVSAVSTALDINLDTAAPSAPAGLDLAAADDSGASSTDNLKSRR